MKTGYNWLNIIQNYTLPPICILCGNAGMTNLDLCDSCYRHLPGNHHGCRQCAEVLDIKIPAASLCGRCSSLNPAFDRTYAPFLHQGAPRYLITSLKFSANYKNARLLGSLLANYLQTHAERPDLILPVPLYKSRYRERGFNQSIEIARTVAKQLKLPLDVDSCIRHRDTPHQTSLTAKERRHNISNAFSVIKPITAQHVALVDDVMTTGSTVHELAAVLKKSGVKQVDIWVCARA
ncbi:Phosphoribosyltransferase [Crenothrix polyspora]|uniref:Phosphoribosyltransferase n=1 Tax=Crenothrix polyspora TaxID=360316 RepID=A0A1R4H8B3_9GAMM|nr:ComF family protein [Crenothrix polyspora]SJM92449.1 Phosphoribosyltransferase [Crenothrix polyspora]